jgi:hypothetical protein
MRLSSIKEVFVASFTMISPVFFSVLYRYYYYTGHASGSVNLLADLRVGG